LTEKLEEKDLNVLNEKSRLKIFVQTLVLNEAEEVET